MKGGNMNNYYKVVNDFLMIAKQNPFIKGVEYGNIYEQHNSGNIEYNTFTLTQGENSSQTENEITYNFIAFVTDRLLEDKSNLLYVQSSCKTILDTILTTFKEKHSGWSIDTEIFSFWEEKFNDYCAGCFVNFSVTIPIEFSCVGVIEEGGANTIEITSNGTYDVTNYDTAVVNVSGSVSDLKYYYIMPHNYGVPQINYSDITTTLEIKFRLKSTVNQSIYDDGYTSLIYEDNQYKARFNGGEWKETLIRETDAPETRVIKLTGTKLQIGYYLFDLEDGGHQWSYGQQMYIGKGENVGDIDIYYCKLYWDKGDFVDYEPFIENGETVLKDAVSGNVLSIDNMTETEELPELYINKEYTTSFSFTRNDNWIIKGKVKMQQNVNAAAFYMGYGNFWAIGVSDRIYLQNGSSANPAQLQYIPYTDKPIEFVADNTGKWIVNGVEYHNTPDPNLPERQFKIFRSNIALYYLEIYKNGELMFMTKNYRIMYKDTNQGLEYITDVVSKKMLNSTPITSEISTLLLDYDEPSDFQTVTLSNEEYEAVRPVLAKIRGEEIVDNEPREVVE